MTTFPPLFFLHLYCEPSSPSVLLLLDTYCQQTICYYYTVRNKWVIYLLSLLFIGHTVPKIIQVFA